MNLSELLNQFLETVKDPTEDPRRTLALIGIGLIAFLLVAVVVFILLPPEKPENVDEDIAGEEGAGPGQAGWHSKVLLGISLALVLIVLAGFVYGDHRSRQDEACLECHVLKDVAASWEQSSHAMVDCVGCHSSPGAFGAIDTRVRALANAVKNVGGDPGLHEPAVVNQGSCRSCHEDALTTVLTVKNVRVRHQDFADRVACGQCHEQVGHEGPGTKVTSRAAVMSSCADCHDGRTAPRECSTCHVGDIAYAGRGPDDFAPIQLAAPTTCRGCHSLEGCNECHGIEMPHPQDWADPKQHAPQGAFDTELCVRCHDAGCSECHIQIHTNHVPDWKSKHQTADRQSCTQCHSEQKVGSDMCRLCHEPAGT